MTRQLPLHPNIEHLRKEAKALHKALKQGDSSCCPVLRRLDLYRDLSDQEILGNPIPLSTTQFALALDYGFKSWPDLVERINGSGAGTTRLKESKNIDEKVLRYIENHSEEFRQQVVDATRSNGIKWMPGTNGDLRWQGMEFMRAGGKMLAEWDRSWPVDIDQPGWDIMCRVMPGRNSWERVYIWCTTSADQIVGSYTPTSEKSYDKLHQFFSDAQRAFKITGESDWLQRCYPYASRLAVLGFLKNYGSCGRLLFVHCTSSSGTDRSEWEDALNEVHDYLGLTGNSTLERRFHRSFLEVPV